MAKSVATYRDAGKIDPASTQEKFVATSSNEKIDALSAGLVQDSKTRTTGALKDGRASVANVGGEGAPTKRMGAGVRAKKSVGQSVPVDGEVKAQPSKLKQAARDIKSHAAAKAIDELNESDELEGISDIYSHGKTLNEFRRARRAARAAKKAANAGKTASVASSSANAGTSVASSKTAAAEVKRTSSKDARKELAKRINEKRMKALSWSKSREVAAAKTAAKSAVGSAAKTGAAKGIAAKLTSLAAPVAGIVGAILAFIIGAMLVSQIVSAIFGFWEDEAQKQSLDGLPAYITYEMVEAALQAQEDYGHPAGCTLAQIIVESGQGDTMSLLATRDHNLFGMKWSSSFALCPEVSGKASWLTYEEYSGSVVTITSYFTVFNSDADCIKFRSRVFLANSRYAGNSLIQEAIAEHSSDKMAEGLKDAGWATSSSYVESLKSVMDTYNLRRFDTMTVEDLANAGLSGDAIVAAAQSQLGVPYVWGGTTPGVGLDCSGLTQYCYKQAGISIPRNSEDQYASGTKKPVSQAQIGDILWRPGHVAIYIGDDKYIHAPYTGEVVKVSSGISYFSAAVSYR